MASLPTLRSFFGIGDQERVINAWKETIQWKAKMGYIGLTFNAKLSTGKIRPTPETNNAELIDELRLSANNFDENIRPSTKREEPVSIQQKFASEPLVTIMAPKETKNNCRGLPSFSDDEIETIQLAEYSRGHQRMTSLVNLSADNLNHSSSDPNSRQLSLDTATSVSSRDTSFIGLPSITKVHSIGCLRTGNENCISSTKDMCSETIDENSVENREERFGENKDESLGNCDCHLFLYRSEAWEYYIKLKEAKIEEEKTNSKEGNQEKEEKILYNEQNRLKEVAQLAREKYVTHPFNGNTTGNENAKKRVREQVESMPTYKPYFIYVITLVQTLCLGSFVALDGLGPVSFVPFPEYREVKTFLGTETVEHWYQGLPNPWIGPTPSFMIKSGAVFAPCLRGDDYLSVYHASLVDVYTHQPEALGCCEVDARNTAGTTTRAECDRLTDGAGFWREVSCQDRAGHQHVVSHNLWPCCVGWRGECELMTLQHCILVQGYYHIDGSQHCSQVNCFQRMCGMGGVNMKAVSERPFEAANPNQWWRYLLSPFYTVGFIHLLLVIIVHWLVGRPIEITAGWLRVSIIYFLSAIGGTLVAVLFEPYKPHVGSSAALFGLLGVLFVEIVQSWSIIEKPWRELCKLLVVTLALFLFGTLPFIDNFSHVGGFVVGVLCALLLLPYITFGPWSLVKKKVLVVVSLTTLVFLFITLFLLFHHVQNFEFCLWCYYFDCIPYSKNLCNH